MIEMLNADEFSELYKKHLCRDFPEDEQRPLHKIQRAYLTGNYLGLTYYEDGLLAGYASFVMDKDIGGVLLDYFAVMPELRNNGAGTRFMNELLKNFDKNGFIIEAENPAMAKDSAKRKIRERRIRFYTRLGAEISSIGFRVAGVDYVLLWLPIHKKMGEVDVVHDINALYDIVPTDAPTKTYELSTKNSV